MEVEEIDEQRGSQTQLYTENIIGKDVKGCSDEGAK